MASRRDSCSWVSIGANAVFGLHQLPGLRKGPREDRCVGLELSKEHRHSHLFCVFDGHGGCDVADRCVSELAPLLRESLRVGEDVAGILESTFEAFNEQLRDAAELQGSISSGCGSTATVVVLSSEEIVVAHVGDSRAVLHSHFQKDTDHEESCVHEAVALTRDHTPEDNADEQLRVEAEGGYVFRLGAHDVLRVGGQVAVSRALGDHDIQGISAVPEVLRRKRRAEDWLLIVASDGLWHKVSNEESGEIADAAIVEALEAGSTKVEAMQAAAEKLAHQARMLGSYDDISVLVVLLNTGASLDNLPCCRGHRSSSLARHTSVPAAADSLLQPPRSTAAPAAAPKVTAVAPIRSMAFTRRFMSVPPAASQDALLLSPFETVSAMPQTLGRAPSGTLAPELPGVCSSQDSSQTISGGAASSPFTDWSMGHANGNQTRLPVAPRADSFSGAAPCHDSAGYCWAEAAAGAAEVAGGAVRPCKSVPTLSEERLLADVPLSAGALSQLPSGPLPRFDGPGRSTARLPEVRECEELHHTAACAASGTVSTVRSPAKAVRGPWDDEEDEDDDTNGVHLWGGSGAPELRSASSCSVSSSSTGSNVSSGLPLSGGWAGVMACGVQPVPRPPAGVGRATAAAMAVDAQSELRPGPPCGPGPGTRRVSSGPPSLLGSRSPPASHMPGTASLPLHGLKRPSVPAAAVLQQQELHQLPPRWGDAAGRKSWQAVHCSPAL